MAGHTNEPDQSFVAGLGQSLHCTVGTVGLLPVVLFDQVVELDEIDMVDAESFERQLQFGPSTTAGSIAGLGCKKDLAAM